MAKVKEVTVYVEAVKNLGNYQSIRFGAGMTLEVEEGDDYNKIYSRAWDITSSEIEQKLEDFSDSEVNKGL